LAGFGLLTAGAGAISPAPASAGARPDLVVTISADAQPYQGSDTGGHTEWRRRFTVANRGDGASGPYYVDIRGADGAAIAGANGDALQPGHAQYFWIRQGALGGCGTFSVTADPAGLTGDRDPSNNRATAEVCQYPQISLHLANWGGSLGDHYLEVEVANDGAGDATLVDVTFDGDEGYHRTVTLGLVPGRSGTKVEVRGSTLYLGDGYSVPASGWDRCERITVTTAPHEVVTFAYQYTSTLQIGRDVTCSIPDRPGVANGHSD
jgi:hypothetical protein